MQPVRAGALALVLGLFVSGCGQGLLSASEQAELARKFAAAMTPSMDMATLLSDGSAENMIICLSDGSCEAEASLHQ